MTREMTFSPRSHEERWTPSTHSTHTARVDDEYVFTVVTGSRHDAEPTQLVVRADPNEGRSDELVLHVTRQIVGSASRRTSETVTLSTPTLETPPRVRTLESILGAWCRRQLSAATPDGERGADDASESGREETEPRRGTEAPPLLD